MITVEQLLKQAVQMEARDVYICEGMKPRALVNSSGRQVMRKMNYPEFSVEDVNRLIPMMMTEEKQEIYRNKKQADFLFTLPNIGRFRVHAYSRCGNPACVVRVVRGIPKDIQDLNLPQTLFDLCEGNPGLVIVTGAAGSGKSMTAAALIQQILMTQPVHAVTLERPVEYELFGLEGVVSRLEVGGDVLSYEDGAETLVNSGADVLMVGALENADATVAAVRAAACGYRVFTTLNSASPSLAVSQIMAVLHEKDKSMAMLFSQLNKTIISQSLVYKENILTPDIKIVQNT